MDPYLILFAAAAIVLTVLLWHRAKSVRLPFAIYVGSYTLTSLVGATLYGIWGNEILAELYYGLDLSVLGPPGGPTYWGILFAPLIVPTTCVLLLARQALNEGQQAAVPVAPDSLSIPAFLGVFAVFSAYCLYALSRWDFPNPWSMWTTMRGDYLTLILLRTEMMDLLGSLFFGFVYVSLPTLSYCALYQAIQCRGLAWWLVLLLTIFVTAVFSIWTVQKSIVLVYLVFLAIGLVELKWIGSRTASIYLLSMIGVLTVLQSLFNENATLLENVTLIIFRTTTSYPYYLAIYPEALPYAGIDLGQHMLGIGEAARDNLDVFSYMYPINFGIKGAVAAPAHVMAYAQGGPPYAIVTLVIVGVILLAVANYRHRIRGALPFALYMQSLVALYYLTQTSLRDVLFSSYGILWALLAIGMLAAAKSISQIAREAAARA